jgi:hypothetical protein
MPRCIWAHMTGNPCGSPDLHDEKAFSSTARWRVRGKRRNFRHHCFASLRQRIGRGSRRSHTKHLQTWRPADFGGAGIQPAVASLRVANVGGGSPSSSLKVSSLSTSDGLASALGSGGEPSTIQQERGDGVL